MLTNPNEIVPLQIARGAGAAFGFRSAIGDNKGITGDGGCLPRE